MKLLQTLLFVLAGLGVYYVYCGYTESFVTMAHAEFPSSQDGPLLEGDYKVKQNPELSKQSYETNSSFNSTSPVGSYEQVTNNKELWSTPDNGNCSPAEFCGSLYESTQHSKKTVPQPNDSSTRVNYYNVNDDIEY